jgi:hypothetical protein
MVSNNCRSNESWFPIFKAPYIKLMGLIVSKKMLYHSIITRF